MPKFSDLLGTIWDSFTIGIGGTGVRSLKFRNQFTVTLNWTPTANRTLTLPDGDGAIARLSDVPGGGFWNEITSTVPTSPTNNYRWYELDTNGVPVEGWYYDLANTRWLSSQTYSLGSALPSTTTTSLSASANIRVSTNVPGTYNSLLITRVDHQISATAVGTTTPHNTTNSWSLNVGALVGAGTNPIAGISVPTTNGLAAGSQSNYSQTPNVVVSMTNANAFVVYYNKTGTPTNIFGNTVLTVRKIR